VKLVQDWRSAPKWFSMQAVALLAVVQGAWLAVPEDVKTPGMAEWVAGATFALALAAGVGRVVDQALPKR
jgi:hypothetical protein